MSININFKREFTVNAKKYNSIEEMPDDVREIFNKTISAQAGSVNRVIKQTKITFNGTEYKSVDDMPQDVRQFYDKLMTTAGTGSAVPNVNVLPDMITEKAADGRPQRSESFGTGRAKSFRNQVNTEPALYPRILVVSIIVVVLILLLYYFFRSK